MTDTLEHKIEIDETQGANNVRSFFDTQRVAIPGMAEVDNAALAALMGVDEALLAFGGMHRSVTAFENTLATVSEDRVHETAVHIAGVLESMLPRSAFTLARVNRYFMFEDPNRGHGNGNWLFRPNREAHTVFTPPSSPFLLDSLLKLATIEDEAKLIDDTVTHMQHAKMRKARREEQARQQENAAYHEKLREHMKAHSTKKDSKPKPKPFQSSHADVSATKEILKPKMQLTDVAFINFRTGDKFTKQDLLSGKLPSLQPSREVQHC